MQKCVIDKMQNKSSSNMCFNVLNEENYFVSAAICVVFEFVENVFLKILNISKLS